GAAELRGGPAELPGGRAAGHAAALPLVRRRAVPGDLPDVRGRAADLHPVAHPGARPPQPDRRADPDRGPWPAVLDLPDPALCEQPRPVLAAEERRRRLPALRRAGP